MAIQIGGNDFDLSEIDRLVDELAHPPKRQAPKPVVTSPVTRAEPALATASEPAARESVTRGRAWSTVQLHMPAARTEARPSLASTITTRVQTWRETAREKLHRLQFGALSVRVFVALGIVLSAAMPYWPYSHAWSWGLLLYLCAIELVVVTGIWGAKITWDARLPAAHTAALGTVIWGLGLFVWEAAPRLAYV